MLSLAFRTVTSEEIRRCQYQSVPQLLIRYNMDTCWEFGKVVGLKPLGHDCLPEWTYLDGGYENATRI